MRNERLLPAGRLLAWSSPGLLVLAAIATVLGGAIDAGGSGWLAPLLTTLVAGSLATGIAGVLVCTLAARRLRGRSRSIALRSAGVAAAIPLACAFLVLVSALIVNEEDWWRF